MIFKQYYLSCLAHASYLLGDETTKTAVLVDPQRDVDEYVKDAAEMGLTIRHVFLTHFHADFLAGHLDLRDRFGATIHLGARAKADFDVVSMTDGERLSFPGMTLEVLETPGHTPESISIVVYDHEKSAEKPWAVLTGDTLFVGDVGRPDLMASIGISAEELATELHSSLHDKLLQLPDTTIVYPAHGAGSMCGKALGTESFTTIGRQRVENAALQPMPVDEFIAYVTANQPIAPAYFLFDAMQNRREHETLPQVKARSLLPLSLARVDELMRSEPVQVIDTRDADAFARGYLPGSLNLGLDGSFATWAGSVLEKERPIIVIAEPGREEEVVVRLGRIGYDWVMGYLDGGPAALQAPGVDLERSERVQPAELETMLDAAEPPVVVDVRGCGEFAGGHIAGAMTLPLQQLKGRLGEIPFDRDIVFVCRSGYRSSVAASVFRALRGDAARDLSGGMLEWKADQVGLATA